MSERLLDSAARSRYAEALETRPGALERASARLATWLRRDGEDLHGFADRVAALALQLRARAAAPSGAEAARLLRRRGLRDDALVPCFAALSEAHRNASGSRLGATEIMAARAMLAGRLAAVADPAARSRAALVAAAAAALAGLRVHVLLSHGELARRRAAAAAPLLGAVGLEAGVVAGEESMTERRAAYARPIVFVDAREAATDHLRDRLVLRGRASPLELEVEALAGRGRLDRLVQAGLHFAVVEDAERILVEDASAPLAILGAEQVPGLTEVCSQALRLADALVAGEHYVSDGDTPWPTLTEAGEAHLAAGAAALGGVWAGAHRRALLVAAAIAATRALRRGRDYEVHGSRILAAPGLDALVPEDAAPAIVRMLELKEGCDPGDTRRVLARIAPERFHRRYLRLGGVFDPQSGAAGALAAATGRRLAPIDADRRAPATVVTLVEDQAALVAAVAERAGTRSAAGSNVVVVTPDAARAGALRVALDEAGVPACVVDERSLPLMDGVPADVIVAGVLPARWAQARALATAAPGGAALVAARDDPLIGAFGTGRDRAALAGRNPARAVARIQRRAERAGLRVRDDARKLEDHLGETLAYAGRRM